MDIKIKKLIDNSKLDEKNKLIYEKYKKLGEDNYIMNVMWDQFHNYDLATKFYEKYKNKKNENE